MAQKKKAGKEAGTKANTETELAAGQPSVKGKKKKGTKESAAQPDTAPEPIAKSKAKEAREKPKKAKLVRDSFTMPENEYQAIAGIKKACIGAGFEIKKSELLRIGVALLQKMAPAQIQEALSALPALKAGRPKKGDTQAVQ